MSGMIFYSTPTATFGLVVDDNGRVIEPCPPYARKWALGRDARIIWRQGILYGYHLEWLDDRQVGVEQLGSSSGS